MDRIAKETGAKIGGELYSDALSPPGGPAATYVDMMGFNTKAITDALRSGGIAMAIFSFVLIDRSFPLPRLRLKMRDQPQLRPVSREIIEIERTPARRAPCPHMRLEHCGQPSW